MKKQKKTPKPHEIDAAMDLISLVSLESPEDRRYTMSLKMDGTYEALGRPTFKQMFEEVERGHRILPARSPA